jgi:hypothetical protein
VTSPYRENENPNPRPDGVPQWLWDAVLRMKAAEDAKPPLAKAWSRVRGHVAVFLHRNSKNEGVQALIRGWRHIIASSKSGPSSSPSPPSPPT